MASTTGTPRSENIPIDRTLTGGITEKNQFDFVNWEPTFREPQLNSPYPPVILGPLASKQKIRPVFVFVRDIRQVVVLTSTGRTRTVF